MRNYIIITKEQAEQIRGRHGKYSAIEPVPSPDGNYLVPERCLDDPDLKDIKDKIQSLIQPAKANVQNIEDLPEMGQPVVKDKIYKHESDDGFPPLVIARQNHVRTEHDPKTVPALFSFFRENSDTLEWIMNEWVELGWKRVYGGKTYEVIQAHQTQSDWTPPATPALWKIYVDPLIVSEWTYPIGYIVDQLVTYQGSTYKCLQAHTSISTWHPVATINVLWKRDE